MASTGNSLAALTALLRDGENVISPHVRQADEEPALGALAAAGPRAAEAPDEYLLLIEAIREGYLLHYETPRVIEGAEGACVLALDCGAAPLERDPRAHRPPGLRRDGGLSAADEAA